MAALFVVRFGQDTEAVLDLASTRDAVWLADIAPLGAPQVDCNVAVQRANSTQCTYRITVRNLTNTVVTFDGRYAALS